MKIDCRLLLFILILNIVGIHSHAALPDANEFQRIQQAKTAYELFGVDPMSSEQQVKRSFRQLIKAFHPDTHPGISDTEKRSLEQELHRITAAWDAVKQGRGQESLDGSKLSGASNGQSRTSAAPNPNLDWEIEMRRRPHSYVFSAAALGPSSYEQLIFSFKANKKIYDEFTQQFVNKFHREPSHDTQLFSLAFVQTILTDRFHIDISRIDKGAWPYYDGQIDADQKAMLRKYLNGMDIALRLRPSIFSIGSLSLFAAAGSKTAFNWHWYWAVERLMNLSRLNLETSQLTSKDMKETWFRLLWAKARYQGIDAIIRDVSYYAPMIDPEWKKLPPYLLVLSVLNETISFVHSYEQDLNPVDQSALKVLLDDLLNEAAYYRQEHPNLKATDIRAAHQSLLATIRDHIDLFAQSEDWHGIVANKKKELFALEPEFAAALYGVLAEKMNLAASNARTKTDGARVDKSGKKLPEEFEGLFDASQTIGRPLVNRFYDWYSREDGVFVLRALAPAELQNLLLSLPESKRKLIAQELVTDLLVQRPGTLDDDLQVLHLILRLRSEESVASVSRALSQRQMLGSRTPDVQRAILDSIRESKSDWHYVELASFFRSPTALRTRDWNRDVLLALDPRVSHRLLAELAHADHLFDLFGASTIETILQDQPTAQLQSTLRIFENPGATEALSTLVELAKRTPSHELYKFAFVMGKPHFTSKVDSPLFGQLMDELLRRGGPTAHSWLLFHFFQRPVSMARVDHLRAIIETATPDILAKAREQALTPSFAAGPKYDLLREAADITDPIRRRVHLRLKWPSATTELQISASPSSGRAQQCQSLFLNEK